jgi:hypothetical protein
MNAPFPGVPKPASTGQPSASLNMKQVDEALATLDPPRNTSRPYDPMDVDVIETLYPILACLKYLVVALQKKDAFTSVTVALRAGILQSLLCCNSWIIAPESPGYNFFLDILRWISLYTIYSSFLVCHPKYRETWDSQRNPDAPFLCCISQDSPSCGRPPDFAHGSH